MTNSPASSGPPPSAGALSGIVVLDLGQIYAGPYCTHLLRSLGATVIKIEPFGGEPIRWRSTGETSGQAFLLLNAGKQGVRLDLKNPRGRDILLGLVRQADVLVENFAPGVLERLGLGWDVLRAIRPELVLASARAYGSHPATQGLRGMDVTVQAVSGIVSATGFPDSAPVKAGAAVVDFSAGTHLAAAVLAALFQRERTGTGQHVEVAMQDAIVPTLTSNLAGLLESSGEFPERTGNRHGGLAVCPYNIYPARDGWLAILPMLRERGMITEIGQGARSCTILGSPLQMSDSPAPVAHPAPLLGEDTASVLREVLGLAEDEITRLAESGVI